MFFIFHKNFIKMNRNLFFILFVFIGSYLNGFAQAELTESSMLDEDFYLDDVVKKTHVNDNRVLSYMPIREADITWQKRLWRLIDTRERMNLVFRAEEKPFFNLLRELLENGEISAFEDERFTQRLTFEEVESKLYREDTITVFDIETYEETIEIVKNIKDWRNVFKYRIKEDWYFDKQTSMLRNKILGIAPIYTEVNQEGGYSLDYPLFWVYYPEARMSLAKHQVLNDENDAAPMTWSDRFDFRYFTSIIIKRTNVLDYRVQDFFDETSEMYGIDVLLESERIKAELFNFEHDLWEY
jgi:gliding motility associated protien GldN